MAGELTRFAGPGRAGDGRDGRRLLTVKAGSNGRLAILQARRRPLRHAVFPPVPMAELILFNKPYGVLSQFTDREQGRPTLADFIAIPRVRPAGRLDFDSEGLMLLTDDGAWQARIADPRHKMAKTYWVQVEGVPGEAALASLRRGVPLGDGPTRPAEAHPMGEPPGLWPRDPPIRHRLSVPDTWLALTLREGRNRQVRRMTAAVGHPTLRLIRWSIGPWTLAGLAPGEWRRVSPGADEWRITRPPGGRRHRVAARRR